MTETKMTDKNLQGLEEIAEIVELLADDEPLNAAPKTALAQALVAQLRRLLDEVRAVKEVEYVVNCMAEDDRTGCGSKTDLGRDLEWQVQRLYEEIERLENREGAPFVSLHVGEDHFVFGSPEATEFVRTALLQRDAWRVDAERWRAVKSCLQVHTDDFEEREYMPPSISTVLSVDESQDMMPGRLETPDAWADEAIDRVSVADQAQKGGGERE